MKPSIRISQISGLYDGWNCNNAKEVSETLLAVIKYLDEQHAEQEKEQANDQT